MSNSNEYASQIHKISWSDSYHLKYLNSIIITHLSITTFHFRLLLQHTTSHVMAPKTNDLNRANVNAP